MPTVIFHKVSKLMYLKCWRPQIGRPSGDEKEGNDSCFQFFLDWFSFDDSIFL